MPFLCCIWLALFFMAVWYGETLEGCLNQWEDWVRQVASGQVPFPHLTNICQTPICQVALVLSNVQFFRYIWQIFVKLSNESQVRAVNSNSQLWELLPPRVGSCWRASWYGDTFIWKSWYRDNFLWKRVLYWLDAGETDSGGRREGGGRARRPVREDPAG